MSRPTEPNIVHCAPLAAQPRAASPATALTPAGVLLVALLAVLAGAGMAWVLLDSGLVATQPPLRAAVAAAGVAALLPALWLLRSVRTRTGVRGPGLAPGTLDAVTGVSSREQFLTLAEREFARSRRYGIGAALLLVDVDRFRRLLDEPERSAGELVLREVATSIQATLRGADALARFGPGQVVVFIAHADALGALDVAERIRERVEQLEIACRDQRLHATVSVGAVLMRPAHLSLQAVVEDAEAALMAARQAGGNCVRAAPIDRRRLPQGWRGPSVGDNQAAGS